ncbi:hypothetical protein [Nocardioides lijunqiniae]|uniref:hypothetical protein n=1 Tax=Nocardioides lijunqiniae TaxID=2760832 RepID=UPI001877A4F5|nr:hypothetical protein [Nocardioides lijunqiniae]
MGDDILKAVATGLVTLTVGVTLFLVQQGGKRRRLRREIREELELIEKLPDGVHKDRLRVRVNGLLGEYAPATVISRHKRSDRVANAIALGLIATYAAVVVANDVSFPVASIGAGAIGIVLGVTSIVLEERRARAIA